MEHSFNYAVIRALPDPRKGEVINIGIVVFHSDTIDTRLAPSLNKLLALDPNIDIAEIRALPDTLLQWAARFDTVAQRRAAIGNFGIVTLSEPGNFRTVPGLTYEDQITNLMKSLVLPRNRDDDGAALSINRISTSLREIFRRKEVLGKETEDIHRHLVVPNFPIDADENIYSDFAFKNGAYWFTETADFRAKSRGMLDNMRVASFAAIKLSKAKKRFHQRAAKTFVVYAASKGAEIGGQLNLMSEYASELVNIENKRELAHYTQSILDVVGSNRQLTA